MLQTSILIHISNGRVLPNQTPVHDSKCCKRLFTFPLQRGEYYPTKLLCMPPNVANVISHYYWQWGSITQQKSSVCLKMLQTSIFVPIGKGGVLPNQSPVHDSKCCKGLFSFLLGKWESYPTKLLCMTINVANVLSHSH